MAALCTSTLAGAARPPILPEMTSARETTSPPALGSRRRPAPCLLQPGDDLAAQHQRAEQPPGLGPSRLSPPSPPPEARSIYPAAQPLPRGCSCLPTPTASLGYPKNERSLREAPCPAPSRRIPSLRLPCAPAAPARQRAGRGEEKMQGGLPKLGFYPSRA